MNSYIRFPSPCITAFSLSSLCLLSADKENIPQSGRQRRAAPKKTSKGQKILFISPHGGVRPQDHSSALNHSDPPVVFSESPAHPPSDSTPAHDHPNPSTLSESPPSHSTPGLNQPDPPITLSESVCKIRKISQ